MTKTHESKIIRPFVEINLAEHCNLTCSLCDHFSPFLDRKFADLRNTENDLIELSKVLHTNHFLLLGGEPLLHPEFDEFCRIARASEISHQVVLVTNGTLLHKMSNDAWQLLDGIRISRYPGVNISISREELKRKSKKYKVWIRENNVKMFDVVGSNAEIVDPSLRKIIFMDCFMAQICNTIRDGRYYRCPPSVFMQQRLSKKGVVFDNRAEDSVEIQNNPNLKSEIESLLARSEPLDACRYCLGSLGHEEHHYRLNKREVSETSKRPLEPKFDNRAIREDFIF